MIFDYIIYIMVTLLSGLASYYLTNNFYILIGTFVIYFAYFLIYEILFKRKERRRLTRNKDLTIFIHDFFLVYSVDFSLDKAISNSQANVSYHLKEQFRMLKEFTSQEQLDRLADYFNSSLYQLFLKTIDLSINYSEDRIKTISFLLEENNRYVYQQKILQKSIWRSLCEFSMLWIVSFLILITLRFAINNYFANLAHAWFYLAGVILYFLFFLFSIHLFMRSTNGSIKRYEQ